VEPLVLSGTAGIVLSGTALSCYRERKSPLSYGRTKEIRAPNLDSNIESNSSGAGAGKNRLDQPHADRGSSPDPHQAEPLAFRKAGSQESKPPARSPLTFARKPRGVS